MFNNELTKLPLNELSKGTVLVTVSPTNWFIFFRHPYQLINGSKAG